MSKGLIVTDLDDVLIELLPEWIHRLNVIYGTNVQVEDVKDWDMTKAFPTVPKSEIYKPLLEQDIYRYMKPVKDAVKYLTLLHEEGYTIKIATASHYNCLPHKLEEAVFPVFKFLTYKDIMVVFDKSILKCDFLIDDNPENLRHSEAYRILMDRPHNQNCDEDTYNCRVSNWESIYNLIHINNYINT